MFGSQRPFLVAGVIAALLAIATMHAQSPVTTLAIQHVTIIDGTGATPTADMTVVIMGDRIARIGRSRDVKIPAASRIVEGAGKFLIPGLRDMHVHLGGYAAGKKALAQLLASGIVGIRDMASPTDEILRLRADVRSGAIPGPSMIVAGPILQRPLPFALPPLVRTVADEADARATIDDLKMRGVDFIKVGDTLPRSVYFAIAAEAKRQRIPFAGHVTPFVSAAEASAAGQRSIEHFGSAGFHAVLIACSSEEAALSRVVQDAMTSALTGGPSPDTTLFGADFTSRLVDTYDARKAAQLFSTFAWNGTWQIPTLVAVHNVWNGKRDALTSRDVDGGNRVFAKYAEVLTAMRKAGVGIMAGTDVPLGPGTAPLHDELVQLVRAGLSPLEALQTATLNPARFMGTLRSEGTVEVGKAADLVLLDANPLDDIANTRRISAVVRSGTLLDIRNR